MWSNENSTWIKHAAAPMRTLANRHPPLKQIMWSRASLVEKAIAHHFAGAYEASIPIIDAQIEGLTRDLTNQSFFSTTTEEKYPRRAELCVRIRGRVRQRAFGAPVCVRR